jgi:predicted nucleotidyltransferase
MMCGGLPESAVAKLRATFSGYPEIDRVVLYGSRALGSYRTGSDIDLTIEAETMDLSELLTIENRIDDLLLPWKVDLSLRHNIDNPELVTHIDRVGMTFYPA